MTKGPTAVNRPIARFCTSALALVITIQTANAQDRNPQSPSDAAAQEPDSETIIVTGSRIARAGFDTVQPAAVIDDKQMEARGYTNIGQALSELPAFGVPGNSNIGRQAGAFGAGQTFVDFFSLGSQRTLTLVNGRRFVSSNTASIFGPVGAGSQVDLSVIPQSLVKRIETIAVGGAPIYGSDAIAGTVNIILKRDFQGLELRAQTEMSQRGDAPEYRLSGLWGTNFAGGRGNISVGAEWNRATGLTTADRFLTSAAGPSFARAADPDSPFQQKLYYDLRYPIFASAGIPLKADGLPASSGVVDRAGNILTFDGTGRLIPLDFGTRTGSPIKSSGGNGFPLNDFGNLKTNTERYLGNILASFELTDNVRWFGEGWYAHSKGTNLRGEPAYNTVLFGVAGEPEGNIVLSLDNPYLDPSDRSIIAANLKPDDRDFLLTRANTDLATGRASSTVKLYRFVTGFDGNFGIGERTYNWDVSANYGHSTTRGRERVIVQKNFENAIDAIRDENNNIICRPGYANASIATFSSTCSPLNLFGTRQFSKEALNYITAIADPVSKNSQFVLNANVNGPLFKLPGGNIAFSAGYEHRREKSNFDPGAFHLGEDDGKGGRSKFGRSITIDPIKGKFHTNEFFGELRIPVISPDMNIPFHSLDLEGSARYIDHSLAGGDWTWTAGGRFSPIQDITLRGNFTRSVRAPAITELFNPTSRAFSMANDPCDRRHVGSGPNPAQRRTNCVAAGIANPETFSSNIVEFTSPISVSGNPALRNEKADSWTVGAVLRPRLIPGLSVAVDWVDIKLKKAILSLGAEQTLEACYDAATFPSAICGKIDRDGGGQVSFVRSGYANASSSDFEGLTAEVAYRQKVAPETTLGLSLNYLYVNKLESRVGSGDIDTGRGEIGDPKHSFTANINVDHGPVNFLWQTQYFGKGKWDADAAPDAFEINGVGDWWLFNASIAYRVDEKFKLNFVVDNVLDKAPPFPAPAQGGAVVYYSGVLGRLFRVSATIGF